MACLRTRSILCRPTAVEATTPMQTAIAISIAATAPNCGPNSPACFAAHLGPAEDEERGGQSGQQSAADDAAGGVARGNAHKTVRRIGGERRQRQHEERQRRLRRHRRRQRLEAVGVADDPQGRERERRQRQPLAAHRHARVARLEDEQCGAGEEKAELGQRHVARRLERPDGDDVVGLDQLVDAEKGRKILRRGRRRRASPRARRARARAETAASPAPSRAAARARRRRRQRRRRC